MNDIKNKVISQCFYLFLLALILRLIYLIIAVSAIGLDELATYFPDTRVYMEVAEHIKSGDLQNSAYMIHVGSGYGIIIAFIQSIFGSHTLGLIGANVILGSLGVVFMYLIAYQLTRSFIVAILAGMINALSTTSISLSCNILSDQPYFTFIAAALWLYICGFKTGKKRWLIVSGLLAGFAAYIRGVGQFWPLIFILLPLIVPSQKVFSTRFQMICRTGLAALVSALMILAWSGWNYRVHDLFVFGVNGVHASYDYLATRAIAEHTEGLTIEDSRNLLFERTRNHFKDHSPTTADRYLYAKENLLEVCKEHPKWIVDSYLNTIKDNMQAGNYIILHQLPTLKTYWWKLIDAKRNWLYLCIISLSALGCIFLFVDKLYFAGLLLSISYAYNTLLIGFSYWQGSRLYYQAELAWAILVAYAVYRLLSIYINLMIGLDQRFAYTTRMLSFLEKLIPKSANKY